MKSKPASNPALNTGSSIEVDPASNTESVADENPALNTGNPVVINPAWNTGIESSNDEAEAKRKKSNLQLPCVDIPGPNTNSGISEARLSNNAPPLEDDQSLQGHVSEGHSAMNLIFVLRNRYVNDSLFRKVLAKPKDFRNFELRDGLIFIKFEDRELLCIPDYIHKGQSIKEVVIDEAHSLLAHLGSQKTLSYLRDHVWWKSMVRDVELFCNSCTTCKRTKTNNQRPYGMLHPLKPPTYP